MTEYVRKRMLGQSEIDQGIAEVAAITASEGLECVLVGGAAMALYGSDRLTGDIDFIMNRLPSALPSGKTLLFGGIQSQSPSGIPVDIIVPNLTDEEGPSHVFGEAAQFNRRFNGVPVPVASAEYLIVLKMIAKRGKDILDMEYLLLSGAVDLEKARRMVKRLIGWYAVEDFDSYLSAAQWKQSRGR